MEKIRYSFKSIEEISQWVRENYNKELGFTFDTPEDDNGDNWEPTGWCGITLSSIFDGATVLIGDYGTGVLYANCTISTGDSIDDVLTQFIADECCGGNIDNPWLKDAQFAVYMDDWDKGDN